MKNKICKLFVVGLFLLPGYVFADGVVDGAPGAPGAKVTGPLSDFELGKYQYCGSDSDCVKTVNGCCDCANGGVDVAVAKDRMLDFQDRFDCLNVACTERAAVPECGSGVVSCVNHKCRYFSPVS